MDMMMRWQNHRTFYTVAGVLVLFAVINGVKAVDMSTGALITGASVNAFCTVTSTNLDFGNYEPLSKNATRPLDIDGSFNVTCTKGSNATITLSGGMYSGNAHGTSRAMSAGGSSPDFISYEIYSNPSRASVWDAANAVQYSAMNKRPTTLSIYGRIPAGQDVGAGYYSDTITITVNF